jgi:hypothetical protein
MTMPRRQLVDASVTRYYHCISRCVRRAFLRGEGETHRKAWIDNQCRDTARVARCRAQLQDLGGFMKALKEPLARLANKEDGCKGVPDHIRSDNGSEFTAKRVREWLERVGVKRLYRKLRDELLAREVFDTLLEAKVLIERWRKAYNTVRPHSSLGYRPPAPGPGVAPPLSACFGYASASRQGRFLGRATLVIETGSISGGRSVRPESQAQVRRHGTRHRECRQAA